MKYVSPLHVHSGNSKGILMQINIDHMDVVDARLEQALSVLNLINADDELELPGSVRGSLWGIQALLEQAQVAANALSVPPTAADILIARVKSGLGGR